MALTLRSGYLDELKSLDRQHQRENAGKGWIDPKWARQKRKLVTLDTIRREEPPKCGKYLPMPKNLKAAAGWIKAEMVIKARLANPVEPEPNPQIHDALVREKEREVKMEPVDYGKAGIPSVDCTKPVQKHLRPVSMSRPFVEGRKFNTLRPPLQRSSLGGFEQMVQGWVKR